MEMVQGEFREGFQKILTKYNDPAKFDSLSKANHKVDIAKEKMAQNLTLAMGNSAALENLDEKTADLLDAAKDFNKDAEYLKDLMAARANRMKVIMIATGVG